MLPVFLGVLSINRGTAPPITAHDFPVHLEGIPNTAVPSSESAFPLSLGNPGIAFGSAVNDFPVNLAGEADAWTPASISGLVGWYDFSDASTIVLSGDGVSIYSIADKSPEGNHMTWPGSLGRVTLNTAHSYFPLNAGQYNASSIGGLNASNAKSYTNGFTLIASVYWPGYNGETTVNYGNYGVAQILVNQGSDIGLNPGSTSIFLISGNDDLSYIQASCIGADLQAHGAYSTPGTLPKNAKSLVTIAADTTVGSIDIRLNKAGISTNYFGPGGTSYATNFRTGNWNQSVVYPPVGLVGELVMYDRKLTPSEYGQLEDYMQPKWATP